MKMIILTIAVAVAFSGCTGLITGTDYKAKTVYQVTKLGVTTFMTQEEIEDAGLDTLDDVTVKVYEIAEGNEIETVDSQSEITK